MGAINPLSKEFNYFIEHQEELVKEHSGKVVVIRDCKVIGVYDSEIEAVNETKKVYAVGTFLVQTCKSGKESYTQTFHSRVII
ncbi:MAG TPA: hypothetical protein VGJ93_02120 [Desulfuromonadaceae bacterium]|jgi:hypothetical protein